MLFYRYNLQCHFKCKITIKLAVLLEQQMKFIQLAIFYIEFPIVIA